MELCWAEVEVVGVGEDNLRVCLILEVAVEDSLHRRSRAYGHKNRSLDCSVVGLNLSGARL